MMISMLQNGGSCMIADRTYALPQGRFVTFQNNFFLYTPCSRHEMIKEYPNC